MRADEPYGPGNQFFRCTFFWNGSNRTTGSCPGDIGVLSGTYAVYYELINSTGFYKKLLSEYGLDSSWVIFGSSTNDLDCTPEMDKTGCLALHSTYEGYPIKAADSAITVANPKDIMTQAIPNIQNITGSIYNAQINIALGAWPGNTDDLVQSLSMAVFMLAQAVESMQSVVDVADSYEAEKKKEMINDILMGVLLVIPFLGELDAVSDIFVALSRIISIIGDVGLGASTIYAIVEDPSNAPLIIMETLLFGGMTSPEKFSSMGKARRDMSKDSIKGLGPKFVALDDKFQSIVSKCRAA